MILAALDSVSKSTLILASSKYFFLGTNLSIFDVIDVFMLIIHSGYFFKI